jgi:hypothetical protein
MVQQRTVATSNTVQMAKLPHALIASFDEQPITARCRGLFPMQCTRAGTGNFYASGRRQHKRWHADLADGLAQSRLHAFSRLASQQREGVTPDLPLVTSWAIRSPDDGLESTWISLVWNGSMRTAGV